MTTKEEIPAPSFILEPALVVSLLTFGTLLNRRSPSSIRLAHSALSSPSSTPLLDQPENQGMGAPYRSIRFFGWIVRVPDNERHRIRLTSRFLCIFPFLMEVWYWLLTYGTYQIARALQALTMGSHTREIAELHSKAIVAIEQWLGIDVELGLQRWVIRSDALLWFANKTYAILHIPATILFIAYSYHYFSAPSFQSTRRTLVLSNCFAFIVFSTWPCMPPRLLPREFGYVDTLHVGNAASIWTTNKFQNQLAAFPSLHFGYSFSIGMALLTYSPHRPIRLIAPLYPLLILLVIMATANHYLLDAVGGFLVTLTAYKLNPLILNLRPLEEWFFWAIGTEKPMDKAEFERAVVEEEGRRGSDGSDMPLMREVP